MTDRAARRWATNALGDEAYALLAERLPASELWSLLMAVLERRAASRAPAALLEQWERDPFTRLAVVDQRTTHAIDAVLLANAAAFEAVEISPLAPLGACSAVGLASQNKIVSGLRGTEVVADPTNVLALECARRLRADQTASVRLATSHRCVRAQPAPKGPGFAQHFRIFCLASAARERKDHAFVVEAMAEHIATHLRALDRLEALGYAFPDRRVTILATPARATLGDRVAARVAGAAVTRDVLDHAYYDGLRFKIDVGARGAHGIPLIDGGAFDWLARLTSNRRLALVASGMGSQLVAMLFRR